MFILLLLSTSFASFPPSPSYKISINTTSIPSHFPHYWKRAIGSGHAALSQRSDWQQALKRAADDYGAMGIRQHGIFDDDMNVVVGPTESETETGGPYTYNFTNIDLLWDVQVASGMSPLVELGFMPYILANCSSPSYPDPSLVQCEDNSGWIRAGTAYPPRDYADWSDLVFNTVSHAVDRYGLLAVQKWNFEVWNEMWGVRGSRGECDLGQYTQTLYKHAARAVKKVDESLRVGGPAGACSLLLKQFVDECAVGDEAGPIPLDFVSFHQYGNPRECGYGMQPALTEVEEGQVSQFGFYWDPACYSSMVKWASDEISKSLLLNLPRFVTEYSVSVGEYQADHDSSAAAAFFLRFVDEFREVLDVSSWWAFSDIFEEVGFATTEFAGFYGLETTSGIAKPVKRAFEFLHNLASEERLESTVEIGISNNNNNNNSNNNAGCRIKSNEGCFDQNWGMDKTCFNYTDMNAFGLEEMTIEKCLDFCYNRGAADGEGIPRTQGERVKYIGLESGKSCWCSSRRVNGNETECGLENSKDCDTECTGDVDETCGGDWRMEVYKVDCDPPPTPPIASQLNTVNAWSTSDKNDADKVNVFISSWDARFRVAGDSRMTEVTVTLDTAIKSATLIKIDEHHANPQKAWVEIGSPAVPSQGELAYLKTMSEVEEEKVDISGRSDEMTVTLQVPPNAAYALRLNLNI